MILALLLYSFSFQPTLASPPSLTSPEQFRDIFWSILNSEQSKRSGWHAPISKNDLDHLIYLPTSDVLKPNLPREKNLLSLFDKIGELARAWQPLNLFENGRDTGAQLLPLDHVFAPLRNLNHSAADRLTLVIVPGVFGEMIHTRAFEEIFRDGADVDKYWRERVVYQRWVEPTATYAEQFSLEKMKSENIPIEELLSVGSIHDNQGEAVANVVLFNTKLLSLESMGDIRDRAALFLHRLKLYFRVMGTPENIAFVGYSRGTMVALEMLAQAKASHEDRYWLPRVKALVSLGGVTYGSDLADLAFNTKKTNPAPQLAQELALLGELHDSLHELSENPLHDKNIQKQNLKIIRANMTAYKDFLFGLLSALKKSPDGAREIKGIKATWKATREALLSNRDASMKAVHTLVLKVILNSFRLDKFITQYSLNIRRMKTVIREAQIAVKQLTTPVRIAWWQNHTIPTHVRYYALTGTMADITSGILEERALAENRIAFDPNLPDFATLKQNYQVYKTLTGFSTNDSQVAIHKARFYPELATRLNPNQKPFPATFLGVLGVHHWGLALEIATETKSGRLDPYPRKALLKTIAATVAADLN